MQSSRYVSIALACGVFLGCAQASDGKSAADDHDAMVPSTSRGDDSDSTTEGQLGQPPTLDAGVGVSVADDLQTGIGAGLDAGGVDGRAAQDSATSTDETSDQAPSLELADSSVTDVAPDSSEAGATLGEGTQADEGNSTANGSDPDAVSAADDATAPDIDLSDIDLSDIDLSDIALSGTESSPDTLSADTDGSLASGTVNPSAAVTIVVLGSSSAAGKNLDQAQYGGEADLSSSWVNRLSAYLASTRPGSAVLNLSKPGYNTYNALPTGTDNGPERPAVDVERNITAALAASPDAIILAYPAVVYQQQAMSLEEITGNLHVLFDLASADGVQVWVSGPNPQSDLDSVRITAQLAYHAAVPAQFPGRYLDFWTPRAAMDNTATAQSTLTDGIHPNAVGHGLMFDVVVSAEIPTLALQAQ